MNTQRFLCLHAHIVEHRQRLFIVGEHPLQKGDGDGHGDDLLGGEGKPQHGKIRPRHRRHPADAVKRANAQQDVRPAVGDHPAEAEAQQKAGIEKKLQEFFNVVENVV